MSLLRLVVLLLATATAIWSGAAGAGPADEQFETLLQGVKTQPLTADYAGLRALYVKTDTYNPYAPRPKFGRLINEQRWDELIDTAQPVLAKDFMWTEGHFLMSLAASKLGRAEQAAFHRAVYAGMVRALTASGDGRTPETAWRVLEVSEEYFLLMLMGLRSHGQALFPVGDHKVYRLEVEGNGQRGFLFFDVTDAYESTMRRLRQGRE